MAQMKYFPFLLILFLYGCNSTPNLKALFTTALTESLPQFVGNVATQVATQTVDKTSKGEVMHTEDYTGILIALGVTLLTGLFGLDRHRKAAKEKKLRKKLTMGQG